MKTAQQQAARLVRMFARSVFNARIVKIDGEYQSKVSKHSAKLMVSNPQAVLQALRDKCGRPIAEHGDVTEFKVKKVGTVELVDHGNHSILRLHNAH